MANNIPESLMSHCMSDKYKYEDTDPETGEVFYIQPEISAINSYISQGWRCTKFLGLRYKGG